jgi:hypothetical protein
MSPFQTPLTGSPHAEIRLRAAFLAGQQTELMNERLSSLISKHPPLGQNTQADGHAPSTSKIHAASGGVRIGGHEDLRKSSHESHRSRSSFPLDPQVRRSMERVRTIAVSGPFGHKSLDSTNPLSHENEANSKPTLKAIPDIAAQLRTAYLLISPLQGWINSLATMTLFGSRTAKSRPAGDARAAVSEHDMKLTVDPTLALFGDDDVFVSIHKLRAWADKMRTACGRREEPKFRYREVAGAGHFWHDREAVRILQEEVRRFVSSL